MRIGHVLGLLCLGLAAVAALNLDEWRALRQRWGAAPAAPAAALHKCLRDGRVSYTDAACTQGSSRQVLEGGTLSVIASPPPPARAAAPGMPNARDARDALVDPQAVDIKQRRMEAVIGQ